MLKLTPEMLAAVYDALRAFPPFSGWNLPPAADVKFRVMHCSTPIAHWTRVCYTDKHEIAVSDRKVGHFDTLALTMAHEMIHVYQDIAKRETANTVHNADFHRQARRICARFGWDYRSF